MLRILPRLPIQRRLDSWVWLIGLLPLIALLALLPLKFAAALIVALLFVVLVVLDPVWGLYGALLSVPIQDLIILPAGLTVTQIVVALTAGTWFLRVLAHPDRTLGQRLQWPWLLFLVWQFLTVLTTPYSLSLSLQQWARWVAAWLAFVLTLGTITDRRRAWGLIVVLLLAPLIAALIGIYQFVDASGPASFLILGGRFARASSTFGKPNPFGGYMNMAWPVSLALTVFFTLRWSREKGRRTLILALVAAGCTALLLAGLFASYSRGGWIGAVFALLGLALLGGRRTAATAGTVLVVCLLVGLLGAFSALPPVVVERIGAITNNIRIFDAGKEPVNDDNFAVVERMAHWQAAWNMWQAYPIFGVGPGNFNTAYPDFFVGRWSISQGHAHNYYLHILAESGFLGLVFYLILISAVTYQALRLRRIWRGTVWEVVALGGCGIMLAVASHNVFENLHVLNLGMQLSGIWGLMIVAQRIAPTSADEQHKVVYAEDLTTVKQLAKRVQL